MGAPFKTGLDYFSHFIGMIKDPKLRIAKMKHGYLATIVYMALVEIAYGDKGYYIDYCDKNKDNIIWDVLEVCQGKYQPDAETIEQVIETLVACELFSGDHFKSKILTSKRIQQTYYTSTVERKMENVDFNIWMLTESEMSKLSSRNVILHNYLNQTIKQDNQPNKQDNQPNKKEKRVKEKKGKETKRENIPPLFLPTEFPLQDFVELYEQHCPTIYTKELSSGIDNAYKNAQILSMAVEEGFTSDEAVKLFKAAEQAEWLKSEAENIGFAWLIEKKQEILAGKYNKIFDKNKNAEKDKIKLSKIGRYQI